MKTRLIIGILIWVALTVALIKVLPKEKYRKISKEEIELIDRVYL